MFNSMEEIIERYKKEVILDGLKLEMPVLPVNFLPIVLFFFPVLCVPKQKIVILVKLIM